MMTQIKARAHYEISLSGETASVMAGFECDVSPYVCDASITDPVMWDRIEFNHGNHYSPATGKFVTPTNGTYLVTVKVTSKVYSTKYDIMVNNNRYAWIDNRDTTKLDGIIMADASLLIQLTVGDEVWVKMGYTQAEAIYGYKNVPSDAKPQAHKSWFGITLLYSTP